MAQEVRRVCVSKPSPRAQGDGKTPDTEPRPGLEVNPTQTRGPERLLSGGGAQKFQIQVPAGPGPSGAGRESVPRPRSFSGRRPCLAHRHVTPVSGFVFTWPTTCVCLCRHLLFCVTRTPVVGLRAHPTPGWSPLKVLISRVFLGDRAAPTAVYSLWFWRLQVHDPDASRPGPPEASLVLPLHVEVPMSLPLPGRTPVGVPQRPPFN